MKKLSSTLIVLAALIMSGNSFSQNTFPPTGSAGIGTGTPNISSILEMTSTSKGVLVPRMNKNQRDLISSPATGLLIYQTTSVPGFYYYDGTQWNALNGWSLSGNAGTNITTNFLGTTDNKALIFRTNNTEQMRITSSGNIGIGTTSPNAKLDVAGTVRLNDNKIYLRPGTDTYHSLGFDADVNGPVLSGFGGGALSGPAAGNVVLRWTWDGTNGNVGIGTASPNAKLDVAGTVRVNNNKIYLRDGTDTYHSLGFDAGVNGPVLSGYGGGALSGPAAGNVVLRWTWDGTNGNVGIGTTTPAYKLDVCGTIRSKEVRVETGWCDYVFGKDYKLPALKDVEAYIKVNQHLPGVTAGSVIENEGLEIGKTSEQMIKKIEELMLYVIDLQKQIDQLKKNNK